MKCIYCGNTSGKINYYGNCISCGAPFDLQVSNEEEETFVSGGIENKFLYTFNHSPTIIDTGSIRKYNKIIIKNKE